MKELATTAHQRPSSIEAYVAMAPVNPLIVPMRIVVRCTMAGGCGASRPCPLRDGPRTIEISVDPRQSDWLRWVGLSQTQLGHEARVHFGISGRCTTLRIDVEEQGQLSRIRLTSTNLLERRSVPALSYVRGRYDEIVPYRLRVSVLNWKSESIPVVFSARRLAPTWDRFTLPPDAAAALRARFAGPLARALWTRAAELEDATGVVGHRRMLLTMLLVFHSRLNLSLGGHPIGRGTLDALVVGRTGTAKTMAARNLVDYFGQGHIISGEHITLAGLIAAAVRDPVIGYTAIPGQAPLSHGALLIVDEAQKFLTTDMFARTSRWRSEGVAHIDKAGAHAQYPAKVRLLWIANPIAPRLPLQETLMDLVDRPEDRRRFDCATVIGDLDGYARQPIRTPHRELDRQLLLHTWSQAAPAVFGAGVTELVDAVADALRTRFGPRLPELIGSDALEEKVARVAAAAAEASFHPIDEEAVEFAHDFLSEQEKEG